MEAERHRERIARCTALMRESGLDVLLLTKPANMTYLTGDGRLCAYAMVTRDGVVALGVPVTDVADVSALAVFDQIVGFDDEIGMIHSIAHYFQKLGFEQGTVGLENTFLNGAMRGVLTHPHAKPAAVEAKDCTQVMTQLRIVKDDGGGLDSGRRRGRGQRHGRVSGGRAARRQRERDRRRRRVRHA